MPGFKYPSTWGLCLGPLQIGALAGLSEKEEFEGIGMPLAQQAETLLLALNLWFCRCCLCCARSKLEQKLSRKIPKFVGGKIQPLGYSLARRELLGQHPAELQLE